MKTLLTILFSFFVLFCFAQTSDWLRSKLKNADSVVLVSHKATAGIALVDSAGKKYPLPELLIAGKPNYSIIKERQVVSDALLDTLIKIMERPFQSHVIEVAKCFVPHHALFVFKNRKTSYLDICFNCQRFEASKDWQKLPAFDDRKWSELAAFFWKLGFRYELAGE